MTKKAPLALLALLLLLISVGCRQQEAATGSVRVVCGAEEYTPATHWIFSQGTHQGAEVVSGGARKTPREVAAQRPMVPYYGDMRIVVEGQLAGPVYYSLYRGEEEVYYRSDAFALPDAPGDYTAFVEASWGDSRRYEGYQYYFGFVYEAEETLAPAPEPEPQKTYDSYPEQAKGYLRQTIEGSLLLRVSPSGEVQTRFFPAANYSEARLSPDGRLLLCKADASSAGEAFWSGYAILDLAAAPVAVYPYAGEQWGLQDHIWLDDNLIGFADGSPVGGQEESWRPIQLHDGRFQPLPVPLRFAQEEQRELIGVGYLSGSRQYVLVFAENLSPPGEDPYLISRIALAFFDETGARVGGFTLPEEYMSLYSTNLLSLLPNNPFVTADGRVLLRVIKRTGENRYRNYFLLVIDPKTQKAEELPYGSSVRLSADGRYALAGRESEKLPYWNPALLDFGDAAATKVTELPATFAPEGFANQFYTYDGVANDKGVYLLAENFTKEYHLFNTLLYWDGKEAKPLGFFPGRDHCSVAGVDADGNCLLLLHGMTGEQYANLREYYVKILD